MDPYHPFDSKAAQGTRCSCGHERSEHVERYQEGKPLRNVCRACAGSMG
jgi:formylmethanofuran dehydrogenase subunit E